MNCIHIDRETFIGFGISWRFEHLKSFYISIVFPFFSISFDYS